MSSRRNSIRTSADPPESSRANRRRTSSSNSIPARWTKRLRKNGNKRAAPPIVQEQPPQPDSPLEHTQLLLTEDPPHSSNHTPTTTRSRLSSYLRTPKPPATLPLHNATTTLNDNTTHSIVTRLERGLRIVVLLGVAYLLGVWFPTHAGWISKLVEYSVVAWATCALIRISSRIVVARDEDEQVPMEQQVPLLATTEERKNYESILPAEDEEPHNNSSISEIDIMGLSNASLVPTTPQSARGVRVPLSPTNNNPINTPSLENQQQQHPSLDPYFVVDTRTDARAFPNVLHRPFPLESDYFTGHMMILIRTPDVDDAATSNRNNPIHSYFHQKQRRFEFQYQLRLKTVPTGRLYFACELSNPVRMGMIQRALVSAAMAFVKSTNANFHYSITGSDETTDDRYEKPHMAFPVEEGMNRVVVTKPGETPPLLGAEELVEDAESIKQRKKGVPLEWNLQDTYTMSLWSAYVDFLEWKCLNLPGIRPFGLRNIIGKQPIYLTLYEMPSASKYHYRSEMKQICELEMCNAHFSGIGGAAEKWVKETRPLPQRQSTDTLGMYEGESGDDEGFFVERNEENEEDEEEVAAELGEGIYLRSGDAVSLRESEITDAEGVVTEGEGKSEEERPASFIGNGGGFAVLQERSFATIIIEKAGQQRRRRKSIGSSIIKDGDTVSFKMVANNSSNKDGSSGMVKYLSLHRGWWLKWVAAVPTKNGFFTIHSTNNQIAKENHETYLAMGGSFILKHKRWSRFIVGVAKDGSVTYGGRMLGLLYNSKQLETQDDVFVSDDEEFGNDTDPPELGDKKNSSSIRPLYLEACDPPRETRVSGQVEAELVEANEDSSHGHHGLIISCSDHTVDVPAWIEVMNRSERARQLVYAVRIVSKRPQPTLDSVDEDPQQRLATMRLRTGRELSEIVRTGLHWRDKHASSPRRKHQGDESEMKLGEIARSVSKEELPVTPTRESVDLGSVKSDDQLFIDDLGEFDDGTVGDDLDADGAEELEVVLGTAEESRPNKGRKLIGKIAKTVKTRTATTGKKVAKVSRGTVNAGKAIVSVRPKNLPKEPKPGKPRSRRKVERDLHVFVSNKAIRRMERNESQMELSANSTIFRTIGEYSPSEQSCHSVSEMLCRMSSVPASSSVATAFNSLLSSHLEERTLLDAAFLKGSSVELGVVSQRQGSAKLLAGCVVARCLWESHWREEWFELHDESIKLYAPLTGKPCLDVSLKDIRSVRSLEPGYLNPLPGTFMLAVESRWNCHYLTFASNEARRGTRDKIVLAIQAIQNQDTPLSQRDIGLVKARFFLDLQNSLESARLIGKGKWAEVNTAQKKANRVVLNSRRMAFDVGSGSSEELETLAEKLLAEVLSFDLNSLQDRPEEFVAFLNDVSRLKVLPLQDLDFGSLQALCTVVNLYHCLLQHALLFTPSGPLTKKAYETFMRTCCYEIGGDIFSLAELNSCIIRGNMSRPTTSKPPYIEAPKRSSPYLSLALRTTTPHLNFLLNTGDTSCVRDVPVLRADCLEEQLANQTAEFLKKNIRVHGPKKQILLPKICEVFRNDFGPDPSADSRQCVEFCLHHIGEPLASLISRMLREESPPSIKFLPASETYYTTLRMAPPISAPSLEAAISEEEV